MSSPSISVMNCGRAFSFASHLAPVVICRPIARECLYRRELHALRCIRDRFAFRPFCCVDAPAQFGKFRFWNIHMKRTNRIHLGGSFATFLCSTGLPTTTNDLVCGIVNWNDCRGGILAYRTAGTWSRQSRHD